MLHLAPEYVENVVAFAYVDLVDGLRRRGDTLGTQRRCALGNCNLTPPNDLVTNPGD